MKPIAHIARAKAQLPTVHLIVLFAAATTFSSVVVIPALLHFVH